jgi:hypothetical protein
LFERNSKPRPEKPGFFVGTMAGTGHKLTQMKKLSTLSVLAIVAVVAVAGKSSMTG